MHFIPDCVARPEETLEVNVEGTRRLLDECRGSSVRSFIFASTAAVYAPTDGPCVEDTTPLRPLEIYGESKLAAEQLVGAFQEDDRHLDEHPAPVQCDRAERDEPARGPSHFRVAADVGVDQAGKHHAAP